MLCEKSEIQDIPLFRTLFVFNISSFSQPFPTIQTQLDRKQTLIYKTSRKRNQTCGRGPSGVYNTPLLDIGGEADSDLVEIAAEDRPAPDGGTVVDGDLASKEHVGGHEGVSGDLGEPLAERDDLPLPSVVPLHSIRRFRNLRRRFGCESAAEELVVLRGERGG